jgi:ABC-type glycerol-3-phosphate transport system permease component
LHSWNLLEPAQGFQFIGLLNYYNEFVNDPQFWPIIWQTIELVFGAIALALLGGTVLALLLNRPIWGKNVLRGLATIPFLVTPSVMTLVWKNLMLSPTFGVIDWALHSLGLPSVPWFSSYPLQSVILIVAWEWTPFIMLVLLAGLQAIPEEVLEAARVDGTNPWTTFWLIVDLQTDARFFVLSTRFMPFAAILVPLFIIFSRLNLLDNLFTLILVYTAMNLPLIIWMARSYFMDLPQEVLESAWLDGNNTLGTIVNMVIPMAAPGLIAAALLAIIFAWNDFFFAVTLTDAISPTLPVMVAVFSSNQDLFLAKISALATGIIIVPVVLGMYAQRHLVRGLTGGALK